MIYIILLILVTMYLVEKKKNISLYLPMIALLIAVIVIGFGVGTDYFSYEYLYNNFSPLSKDRMEIGFESIILIMKSFNLSFHTASVLIRTTILIFTSLWIYDVSEDKSLSLIIYYCMFFFIWTMSAYRQGLVLSIGLYFLLSKRYKFGVTKKIILILLLSLLHKSAFMLLVLLIVDEVKWTKKIHISLLILSLAMTFVPFEKIIVSLSSFSLIEGISKYVRDSFGFFDFPSLMRLSFYLVVFYFYDVVTEDKFNKKVTDFFLSGISIYFMLKFSENTASRSTIYSFMLIILLMPNLLINIGKGMNVKEKKFATSLLISMICIVFLTKDFIAYKNQVGYVGNMNRFDFMTIYNKNYNSFDNPFAKHSSIKEDSEKYLSIFSKDLNKEIQVAPNYDLRNVVIFDPNSRKYGVMNEEGNWVKFPQFSRIPYLYDDVLVVGEPNLLFREDEAQDINGVISTEEMIDFKIIESITNNYYRSKFTEEDTGLGFKDVIENTEDFLPRLDSIRSDHVYKIDIDGIIYHILYFNYYGFDYYIYLDENLVPYSNILHTKPVLYENGFLKVPTVGGTAVYNSKGKLIWFY